MDTETQRHAASSLTRTVRCVPMPLCPIHIYICARLLLQIVAKPLVQQLHVLGDGRDRCLDGLDETGGTLHFRYTTDVELSVVGEFDFDIRLTPKALSDQTEDMI